MKPRLLDLFCGDGGAAIGYALAGWDVYGVDIRPHPRYPFWFMRGDALTFPLDGFDAYHASPPCQAYSVMKSLKKAREHPKLIEPIRERLAATGKPYVIENVPGAPLIDPLTLCGSMFDLRSHRGYLRRHRLFEIGNTDELILVPPCAHQGLAIGVYGHGSAGLLGQRMRTANAVEARVLMGTPEMARDGMSQAIPPAYTELLGRALLRAA